MKNFAKYITPIIFVVGITVANLIVSHFGAWITPYIAFVMIGFEFTLRDYIHEVLNSNKKLVMASIILTGGILTYLVNSAALWVAVASSVAFVCANIADYITYDYFLSTDYLIKANLSNFVSTAIDSVLFVTIAFGLSWSLLGIAAFQFAMKLVGGTVWSFIIKYKIFR